MRTTINDAIKLQSKAKAVFFNLNINSTNHSVLP